MVFPPIFSIFTVLLMGRVIRKEPIDSENLRALKEFQPRAETISLEVPTARDFLFNTSHHYCPSVS